MQIDYELIFQLAGTLIFGAGFIFFLRRYRSSLKKRKEPGADLTDSTFVFDLFFTLTGLDIILVIWSAVLRDLFTEMLVLSVFISWLAWRGSQSKEKE